jgi:hypothetical protein
MSNSIVEFILRHKQIIPVVVALAGIGAYMIPANSLALGAITGSGNVIQSVSQSNSISATNTGKYGGAFANDNTQVNSADNSAFVTLVSGGGSYVGGGGSIKDSGNVLQTIDQSNSISATNSGDFGTANANDNTQVNDASNSATVDISSQGGHHHHGGSIKDSGNVIQSITQSNSISADNSGASGTANANDNTQVNSASNTASVDISSGSNHNGDSKSNHDNHHGDKKSGSIKDSGNVVQSISQSNSISASNSGDHGTANANHNTQVNSASNSADVHISSNSHHKN